MLQYNYPQKITICFYKTSHYCSRVGELQNFKDLWHMTDVTFEFIKGSFHRDFKVVPVYPTRFVI